MTKLNYARYMDQGLEDAMACAAIDLLLEEEIPSRAGGEARRRYTLRGKLDALGLPVFDEERLLVDALLFSHLISPEEAKRRKALLELEERQNEEAFMAFDAVKLPEPGLREETHALVQWMREHPLEVSAEDRTDLAELRRALRT